MLKQFENCANRIETTQEIGLKRNLKLVTSLQREKLKGLSKLCNVPRGCFLFLGASRLLT